MKAPPSPSGHPAKGEATSPASRSDGRAVRSFFWAGLSFGGNKIVVFALTLVLARVLAPDDFGIVAAAMTLIAYFEIGLDLGVGSALIYEQEEGITPRVHTAFTLNVMVCVALTAVGVAAAPAAARFFRVPGEADVFRVLSFYLLIRGMGQVHDALLKRDLDFKRRTLVDVARAVTRAGVSIGLALLGHGVWAIVWGLLAGELSGTVASWRLVAFRPRPALDRTAGGALLRYGLAIVAVRTVSAVSINADYLVVGNRLGPEQLGFYTVAYRLPELLVENVYWIFSSIALPYYSKARTEGAESFRDTMLRALTLLTLFGFPMGTALALVARDAVPVLFSAKWLPAADPMVFLALAAGFHSLGYASGDIYPATGRPGLLFKLNVVLAAVEIASFLAVVPRGLVAVAGVHLASSLGYGLVRLVVANHLVGSNLRECLLAVVPGASVSAGMALCALPVLFVAERGLSSLLGVVAAGSAGAAAGLLLGARPILGDLRRTVRAARTHQP